MDSFSSERPQGGGTCFQFLPPEIFNTPAYSLTLSSQHDTRADRWPASTVSLSTSDHTDGAVAAQTSDFFPPELPEAVALHIYTPTDVFGFGCNFHPGEALSREPAPNLDYAEVTMLIDLFYNSPYISSEHEMIWFELSNLHHAFHYLCHQLTTRKNDLREANLQHNELANNYSKLQLELEKALVRERTHPRAKPKTMQDANRKHKKGSRRPYNHKSADEDMRRGVNKVKKMMEACKQEMLDAPIKIERLDYEVECLTVSRNRITEELAAAKRDFVDTELVELRMWKSKLEWTNMQQQNVANFMSIPSTMIEGPVAQLWSGLCSPGQETLLPGPDLILEDDGAYYGQNIYGLGYGSNIDHLTGYLPGQPLTSM